MQKNRPEIRFDGFADDWEERKLSEFVAYRASHLTASDANDNGNYCLYDANAIIGKTDSEPMKTEYITIIKDGAGVGRIRKMPANTMFIGTMGALTTDGSDLGFVFALLTRFNLSHSCSGSTIPHIYFKDYGNNKYSIPQKEEQTAIGQCFERLDSLIAIQQRKCDRLQALKKSMLEKMFPKAGSDVPEIRFAGFTDAWEQRKLNEILYQRIEHQTIASDAPLLAFSYADGVINPEDKKSNKRDFIMTDKFSKIFSRTELNDIIYNPANVIHGAIHRNKLGTGVVSPIYKIFVCNGVSPKYMGERLHTDKFIQEVTKYIEGTVIKLRTLSPEMFLEMTIEVPPSYEEQEKIGDCLAHLDHLIILHQRKLQKLQECKKALLEKMFVSQS